MKITTRLIFIAIVLFNLAAMQTGLAAQRCSEEWVCVVSEKQDDQIALYVANHKPYPVTVTVALRTRNLATSLPSTITRTIDGLERVLLDQMAVIDTQRRPRLRYWFDWAVGRTDARHDDSYLYRFPYADGQRYRVLQSFNSRFSHTGLERYAVDFKMAVGTPVHAARGGVVVDIESRHNKGCWERGCGRYANFIVILHNDGTTGEYYHLRQNGAVVEVGQRVERGQHIGYSGNTGHTTMPHLHFAVYRPVSWGRTQSLPVRFRTAQSTVARPEVGRAYRPF